MIFLKNPEESLSREEIEELLKEFERWLKREKKMSNYPNARADREVRIEKLRELIGKAPKPPTLRRVADLVESAFLENRQLDVLQDIAEFFQDRLGVEVKTIATSLQKEEVATEVKKPTSSAGGRVIGRVAPTVSTPATPTEFTFWVEDDETIHVETGRV